MSHDTGAVCACSADHQPHPLELEWHHVWPIGMGGPDTKVGRLNENGVWACPTTHTNTHEILRLMVRDQRPWSWAEVLAAYDVPVSRYAYRLALLGFRRWQAGEVIPG